MKVIMIADVSLNGQLLIAENSNHPVPEESVNFYLQRAKQAGNIILGKKAFGVIEKYFGGIAELLPGVEVVVLSTSATNFVGTTIHTSIVSAISHLRNRGHHEIIVGGGTSIYNAFLQGGLIDEMYLHYVPVMVDEGGVLTGQSDFDLVEHKVLGEGVLQVKLRRK